MNDFYEAVDVYLEIITVHSGVEAGPLTLKAAGSLEQEETKHMIINAVASLIIGCNSGIHLSFNSYLLHHTVVPLCKAKPLSLNLKDRTTEINDKRTGYLIMTYDQKTVNTYKLLKELIFQRIRIACFVLVLHSIEIYSRNDDHVLISPWNFLNRT